MARKAKRIKITVEAVEAAVKEPLKPLIIKLLKETQSITKTAWKLSEQSGMDIDYHALYYILLKLDISVKSRLEVVAR